MGGLQVNQRHERSYRSAIFGRTFLLFGLATIVTLLLVPAGALAATAADATHRVPPATAAPISARASTSAPIRRIGGVRPGLGGALGGSIVTTANWAGYDVTGGGFTSVAAVWTQPAVQPNLLQDTDTAFWVGLDGDGSSTVEQCGTEAISEGGVVSYDAWYEVYPDASVTVPLTISPGDQIVGVVLAVGNNEFAMRITDNTTGYSYSTTQYCAGAAGYSAEVIAEAPTDGTTGDLIPLSDFGTVQFGGCSINGNPISSYDWNRINLVSDTGATLATTSALGIDGNNFSVSTATPKTTVTGADANWHRFPVTLDFFATDDAFGSGVAYTDFSVDGGSWTQGTSLAIPAPANHSNDGTHTVRYSSTDNDGNVERIQTCQVKIDTRGAVCAAKNATVKHGKACRLYFKVHDALSAKVTNVLTITTKSGVVKKRWSWGYGENYAGWWWTSYMCRLPRGTYYIRVYGKDLAGNAQSVVGKAHLRVT
jgi:hypothetical protein